MMEEIGTLPLVEDSNGDSTFEFVDDSNGVKGGHPTLVQPVAIPSDLLDHPSSISPTVPLIPTLPSEMIPTTTAATTSPPLLQSSIPLAVASSDLQTPQLFNKLVTSGLGLVNEPITSVEQILPATTSLNMEDAMMSLTSPAANESRSVWGWITNSAFLNKVAEKAKNSVDTMITTLDPGMKEFIYSGGDIDVTVASNKDLKVVPIRDAFQATFGRATVSSAPANVDSMAPQPVGYTSGIKSAEERINVIREAGVDSQAVVAIEGLLVEIGPDRWFEMSCLILRDSRFDSDLQVFTQPTPVPPEYIAWLQDNTPPNYALSWSGFSQTIGQAALAVSGLDPTEWHQAVTGISRKELIVQAAKALSGMYKLALRNA